MNDYKNTKGDSLWVDDWTILFQQSKLTEFITSGLDSISSLGSSVVSSAKHFTGDNQAKIRKYKVF